MNVFNSYLVKVIERIRNEYNTPYLPLTDVLESGQDFGHLKRAASAQEYKIKPPGRE